jgi:cytoskeletal protein CcmA (bactofilin family)
MAKENKNRFFQKDPNQINGLLDKGCNFEGKLTFDGVVQINGEFRGEVFSDGTLVVGRDAHINAKILVDTIIIDGSVEGSIEAKTKIELHRNGTLVANIQTQSFMIEDGGMFQGTCEMPMLEKHRNAVMRAEDVEEVSDSMVM